MASWSEFRPSIDACKPDPKLYESPSATGDRFTSDLDGFAQTAHLQIAQQESPVSWDIVRCDLSRAFEIAGSAGIVTFIQGSLAASKQWLDNSIRRLRPGGNAEQ